MVFALAGDSTMIRFLGIAARSYGSVTFEKRESRRSESAYVLEFVPSVKVARAPAVDETSHVAPPFPP